MSGGAAAARLRAGYLGPDGTFTHEALLRSAAGCELTSVPFATIHDTVMAVHEGAAELALVPIENSLEGSVNATLDALALETEEVRIVGEVVDPIHHCLIARTEIDLEAVEAVISHPQATAQCARFIRARLPGAKVMAGGSTAEAVRLVSEHNGRWAALGTRTAAELYGCVVLASDVEDVDGNETRFVWLTRTERVSEIPRRLRSSGGSWKTAIVFWGVGSETPGWLVRCLSEFAEREVNLTRIESRPRRQGLGRYMFFADLEGREGDQGVADALQGLRRQVQALRVLGSFPAA